MEGRRRGIRHRVKSMVREYKCRDQIAKMISLLANNRNIKCTSPPHTCTRTETTETCTTCMCTHTHTHIYIIYIYIYIRIYIFIYTFYIQCLPHRTWQWGSWRHTRAHLYNATNMVVMRKLIQWLYFSLDHFFHNYIGTAIWQKKVPFCWVSKHFLPMRMTGAEDHYSLQWLEYVYIWLYLSPAGSKGRGVLWVVTNTCTHPRARMLT